MGNRREEMRRDQALFLFLFFDKRDQATVRLVGEPSEWSSSILDLESRAAPFYVW
jgi:hypothetical protein